MENKETTVKKILRRSQPNFLTHMQKMAFLWKNMYAIASAKS